MKIPSINKRWRAWFYPLLILGLAMFIGPVKADEIDVSGEESQPVVVLPDIQFSVSEDGERIRIVGLAIQKDTVKAFLFDGYDVTTPIELLKLAGELGKSYEKLDFHEMEGDATPSSSNEVVVSIPSILLSVKMDSESFDGHKFGFRLSNGVVIEKTVVFEDQRFICAGICLALAGAAAGGVATSITDKLLSWW